MPATTIESPRLSPATRRQIAAQHADAVHRLLAAEGATLALTKAAVDDATRRLVDSVVARGSSDPRDAERSARKAIQDAAAYLGPAFAAALVNGRREAREQSRGQVGVEMGLLAAAMRGQDQEPPALDPAAAVDTSSDETWAAVGGSSMVAVWGAAAIALVGRWKAKGGRPAELPKALRGASPAVASAVERHAVTQSAAAYAEQHRALWDVAIEARSSAAPDLLAEPGLPHGWTEGVLDVWSAILDRKTCPVCWSLDGQMVPLGKPFMGAGVEKYISGRGTREAALHPRCRCLIITTVIPEMLRRRLPGVQIDFAALKDDIREYFESASADSMNLGRRHALPFIQDSLAGKSFSGTGRGTSPEALTRALQRRNFTTAGAPGTPGASARRAGSARRGRQMRLEDPRTAAVRRFPDSEGPVRTPPAPPAPAVRAPPAPAPVPAAVQAERTATAALDAQIAEAPILKHGELSYLRTGMRPESLEYAAQQLAGKGDVTAAALARDPIVLDVYADGKRALGDGRHRLAAAQSAGARAIRVKVRTYGSRGGLKSEHTEVMRIDHTTPVVPSIR